VIAWLLIVAGAVLAIPQIVTATPAQGVFVAGLVLGCFGVLMLGERRT
jgi:hypothetical protein